MTFSRTSAAVPSFAAILVSAELSPGSGEASKSGVAHQRVPGKEVSLPLLAMEKNLKFTSKFNNDFAIII